MARRKEARRSRPALKRGRVTPVLEAERAHGRARAIAALLSEKKALDVVILDVRGLTSYADYLVVASGESERQVVAMAEHVEVKMKEGGLSVIGREGYETGHWVLLDYGEVVAHLLLADARSFYDLEGLWADAPRERVA